MTYFEDLTPYTYICHPPMEHILNVGWLEKGNYFPWANVPAEFITALKVMLQTEIRNRCMGAHTCNLGDAEECRATYGNGELWAELEGYQYVAPALILHYVVFHGYKPPPYFIEGVLKWYRNRKEVAGK